MAVVLVVVVVVVLKEVVVVMVEMVMVEMVMLVGVVKMVGCGWGRAVIVVGLCVFVFKSRWIQEVVIFVCLNVIIIWVLDGALVLCCLVLVFPNLWSFVFYVLNIPKLTDVIVCVSTLLSYPHKIPSLNYLCRCTPLYPD